MKMRIFLLMGFVVVAFTGLALFSEHTPGQSVLPVWASASDEISGSLKRKLDSEDATERREAIQALGGLGTEQAVDILIAHIMNEPDEANRSLIIETVSRIGNEQDLEVAKKINDLLYNEDPIKWKAAIRLGEIGDPRAVEPLIAGLDRIKDRKARILIVPALGDIGGQRAIEGLVRALGHWDFKVRDLAQEALVKLGEPAVEPLIEALGARENKNACRGAATVLSKIGGPRAVEALIELLDDLVNRYIEDIEFRWLVGGLLVEIGEPAVEQLIEVLETGESERIREEAARALGGIGDPRAIEPLIRALMDEWRVWDSASRALVEIGEPAVEPLIKALGDENWRVRKGAVFALGKIGDPRARDALIKVLGTDDHWEVREEAVEALRWIGGPISIKALIEALGDEAARVRAEAAYALGCIGDPQAIELLIEALGDKGGGRYSAWDALIKIGEPAVEPLIEVLNTHKDWMVRQGAASALDRIGDPDAVEGLMRALEDENSWVRHSAIDALARMGEAAVEPLIEALGDEDVLIRNSARDVLVKMGKSVVRRLIEALNTSEDWRVRQGAAYVLGWMADLWRVRWGTASALGWIRDLQGVEALIGALGGDEHREVRAEAASALGKLDDPKAVEPLIQALGTDEARWVRSRAARALGYIGDLRAIEPLIMALGDRELMVRQSAAWALARIGETVVVEGEKYIEALSREFALFQNFPNPFNSFTEIKYRLPERTDVNLAVYDLLGRRVKTLVEEQRARGSYQAQWDGKDADGLDVASGIYLYRLKAGEDVGQTRRMLLLR